VSVPTTYGYDATHQLTSDSVGEDVQSYQYIQNGNRTSPQNPAQIDRNRVLNDGRYAYQCDDEGNLTSRTDSQTGEVVGYEWDYRNRLSKVTTTVGGSSSVVSFEYDSLDRRIAKKLDANADGG
jgi:hypothetical protein